MLGVSINMSQGGYGINNLSYMSMARPNMMLGGYDANDSTSNYTMQGI
jgi:hypothetical protein